MKDPFSLSTKDKNLKNSRVENFIYREEEGSYLPSNQPEKAVLAPPVKKGRLHFLFFIFLFLIFIIFSRLFWLQIIKGEEYLNVAEGNRMRITPLKADRGLIYDRNLNPLVKNYPHFSLVVVPGDLPLEKTAREKVKTELFSFLKAQDFSFKEEKIEAIFQELSFSSYQEKELIDGLDYQLAMKLKLKLIDLPGFLLKIKAQREYLGQDITAPLIGYMGKLTSEELKNNPDYLMTDFKGKTGLEFYYEEDLKGTDGYKKVEVDSLGKEKRVVFQELPQTGQDLILFLDLDLQKKAKEVLEKYIKRSSSQEGSVVVLNPQNGGILAMVSVPSYDNNAFIKGTGEKYLKDEQNPLFFRALAGEYPAGSIIKPIIAAAALQEGIINEKTSFLSQGGIRIGEWFYPDWKAGGHGWTNLTKALAESVNTFFYYLGGGYGDFKGLGPEKMFAYAQMFGLTKPTGIDLSGEGKGLFATPAWKEKEKGEPWYIGNTYHLSIGQGDVLVTPLQVANYTSVFANQGILYQPRLVKALRHPQNGTEKVLPLKIINQNFIDPEHLDLVNQGLRAAVEWGSAQRLSLLPVEIAGKTGTAQSLKGKEPHAWFTGFAPFQEPEIVVTVLIANGGGGDVIAVPAALEIFEYYFSEK